MLVVDYPSKWPVVKPLHKTVKQILKEVFADFGTPKQIITDVQFVCAEFSEYCLSNGIKHVTSLPYITLAMARLKELLVLSKLWWKKALGLALIVGGIDVLWNCLTISSTNHRYFILVSRSFLPFKQLLLWPSHSCQLGEKHCKTFRNSAVVCRLGNYYIA